MVMAASSLWLEAQWFADQGFAVVVADGRGTPGRGPAFEREVHLDLAGPVLEDQVDALYGAAEQVEELDVSRVGIKGWSFGGYLAALAVLARPDVFHAAVAGAPVTDWALYDTYYTERYLGHPEAEPDAYRRSSLLPLAPGLQRPCCSCTAWPTTTCSPPTPWRCQVPCWRPATPTACSPFPG